MRNIFLILGVVCGIALGTDAVAVEYRDLALGSPDAPVTVVDYSSLTCGHCGTFHNETLPRIKQDYVDTGKVRFVFVDFPFDGLGLAGAKLVRCAAPAARWPLLDLMFKTQGTWIKSQRPLDELLRMAGMAGMPRPAAETCLGDKDLETEILTRIQDGGQRHGINSTPTFLVNGQKLIGNQPYDAFKAAIDRALGQ